MGRARQLYGQESSCQWPFIGPMLAAMVRFSTTGFPKMVVPNNHGFSY